MDMELSFRLATSADISAIIDMLADDPIGNVREKITGASTRQYLAAFEKIASDPNQELTVVEMNGEMVGTFQLTFIQYLTHQGTLRAQVEAVRTSSAYRGKGIGTRMFEYIIERAKSRGCKTLQLTSDKRRTEAIRFYEAMGFVATHEGLKRSLK